MGKKDKLEEFLDKVSEHAREQETRADESHPDSSSLDGSHDVTSQQPAIENNGKEIPINEKNAVEDDGILQPIMKHLDNEGKVKFISKLMDFVGNFLVKLIDSYNIQLSSIENSIALYQSSILNNIRTLRNQIQYIQKQGLIPVEKPKPITVAQQMPRTHIMNVDVLSAATSQRPERKEISEDDVREIARQIRQLIRRQKAAKEQAAPQESAIESGPLIDEMAQGKAGATTLSKKEAQISIGHDLESKIDEYRKTQQQQKERFGKKAFRQAAPQAKYKTTGDVGQTGSEPEKDLPAVTNGPVPAGRDYHLPEDFKEFFKNKIIEKVKELDKDRHSKSR